ncbi:hypothetical protein PQ469_09340 [Mucilaginibacter sp. KACC 22773]|uniref:hypothetical protein n=1 Tax=Mucilaginibacter sp. KACC 22773 TaxID=3025671 RepID=UPI00236575A4|nr:hypothetical protein [Mucilaginibacter sp. KACC 22773]WDF80209.1 hypothetical protein PQ469_09340 [Mucilaginibacter sp. KACC 22773]
MFASCVTLSGCKKKPRMVTTTIHGHINTQGPTVIASNVVVQIFYYQNVLGLAKSQQLRDSVVSDINGDYHLSFTSNAAVENDMLGTAYYTFNIKKDPLIKNLQPNGQSYHLGQDNKIDMSVIMYQPFKARFTLKAPPNGRVEVDTQAGYIGLYLFKADSLVNMIIPRAQKTILSYQAISPTQVYHALKQQDTIDLEANPTLQTKNFFVDTEGL